jgi:hypothetical protein
MLLSLFTPKTTTQEERRQERGKTSSVLQLQCDKVSHGLVPLSLSLLPFTGKHLSTVVVMPSVPICQSPNQKISTAQFGQWTDDKLEL